MALIECELAQIMIVEQANAPQVVVLRECGSPRAFPINIGFFEAMAINRHVNGEPMERPMTHDLLAGLIESLSGKLARIIVCDLIEDEDGNGTFYGILVIEQGGDEVQVDCRPSDAIALAVRTGCQIFVDESVLDRVGVA